MHLQQFVDGHVSRLTDTNVTIAWDEIGSGPPIILIMGLGYARWAWDPIVPRLSEHHRVLTFDNRGIGESDSPPGPFSATTMSDDALAVLDAARVDRATVVGSSLGGMIAQELAIRHPNRVGRLVLMSTTPGGERAHPMPAGTIDLMARSADLAPEESLRLFVANALSADADDGLVDELLRRRMAAPQSREGWLAQAAAGTTYDGDGRSESIEAPTLIIHGTDDNVVDHRNAALLGELIPASRVELVPGGHLFFWEDPDRCSDLILDFIAGGV